MMRLKEAKAETNGASCVGCLFAIVVIGYFLFP